MNSYIFFRGIGFDGAVVCQLCRRPKCVESCPEGALTKTTDLGVISVNEKKCTGCRLCEEACPYGALNIHPDKGTPIICNLCKGKPACVEWCKAEALTFSSPKPSEIVEARRLRTALIQFNHLTKKWGISSPEAKEEQA